MKMQVKIIEVVQEDVRRKPIHDRGRANYKPWSHWPKLRLKIGIANILSHVFNAIQHVHPQEEYSFVKMDVDLYNKFFQVFFLGFYFVDLLDK